jgi:hypothetical protein
MTQGEISPDITCPSSHPHLLSISFSAFPSSHFQSDDHLSTALEKYLIHTKLSDYRHVNSRHPFILELPKNCGLRCHSYLKAMVGSSHHNFISSSYAQVYLDESSLMKLQKSSEGKRVIVDYIPWLPSLKVEKFTNSFLRNCEEISLTDADQHTNLDPINILMISQFVFHCS